MASVPRFYEQVLVPPRVHLLHQGSGEVVTQGDNAEGELPPPADILLLEVLQVDHRLPAHQGLLAVHWHDPGVSESLLDREPLPGLFNQKLPNEVLGQLAGLAEEFLVKVVTHCCDICQRFLLRVSQERGCSTKEDVGDDTDAPHVRLQAQGLIVHNFWS